MQRHNVLVLVGIVAIGLGAVVGSGALTQVSADRTATVSVTDDANALVQIAPNTSTPAVSERSNGDMNVVSVAVSDLNDRANTTLPVLDVTNDAGEPLQVTVSDNTSYIDVETSDATDLESGGVAVGDGETVTVHFEIDTSDAAFASGDGIGLTVEADSQGA